MQRTIILDSEILQIQSIETWNVVAIVISTSMDGRAFLQDEIRAKNRVGTLDQIEQNIESVEVQVREMMEDEEWDRELPI